MNPQPTNGGISALYNDTAAGMNMKPIVQIIDLKKITGTNQNGPAKERYRVIISDGHHFQQAMLTTQLHSLLAAESGEGISNTCMIKVLEYNTSNVHNHKIIVLLKVDQLTPPLGYTIGNPQNIEALGGGIPSQTNTPNAPQTNLGNNGHNSNRFQNNGHGYNNNGKSPNPTTNNAPNVATFGQGEQDLSSTNIIPIKLLNPYQTSWTIQARVTNKGQLRTFNNARGAGKFFSIDLLDTQGGEIRATLFNENAEKWNEVLQVGQVYYISKGTVKFVTNKNFTTINNEYELTLDGRTTIQLCRDDSGNIPFYKYNFISIDRILETSKDQLIDVIGILSNVGQVGTITTTKTKAEIPRRNLTLIDTSGRSVEMTIWSDKAVEWNVDPGNVVAAKGVKVSDYNGKTLTGVSSTQIDINPDLQETMNLRTWYQSQGGNVITHSISQRQGGANSMGNDGGGFVAGEYPRRFLNEIKDLRLGVDKADSFATLATITRIKHDNNIHYLACPKEGCNKKVTEENGMYRCSKCEGVYPSCSPRYILSFAVTDHTGDHWLTCFNTEGKIILEADASEVVELKETRQEQRYEQIFQSALFKTYLFKIRAKNEEYQSEQRVKCSVLSLTPVNYSTEARHLLTEIRKYGV